LRGVLLKPHPCNLEVDVNLEEISSDCIQFFDEANFNFVYVKVSAKGNGFSDRSFKFSLKGQPTPETIIKGIVDEINRLINL
jgi:hypothetical protein